MLDLNKYIKPLSLQQVEIINIDESTPFEVFEALAKSKRLEVREAIARNIYLPLQAMELLAKDEAESVRANLVWSNPPESILKILINDPSKYVRTTIAWNPQTPLNILEKLINDTSWEVYDAAFKAYKIAQDRDIKTSNI